VTDHDALKGAVEAILPVDAELAAKLEQAHLSEMTDIVVDAATELYDRRAEEFGPQVTTMVERFTYVNSLDRLWIQHLEAMESVRSGIGLRAIGQRDPLVEYKREGFRMFKQLLGLLDAEVATTIFKIEVRQQPEALPVETALTRAAEQASTNVSGDGTEANPQGSRAERRNRAAATPGMTSATKKKRKKRR
jgi:preprotein translocase subunit SecA